MTKLDGKTPDLAAKNIEQLWKIFLDQFEEGKIDFNKFKKVPEECMWTMRRSTTTSPRTVWVRF